jgi:hypothetical protein
LVYVHSFRLILKDATVSFRIRKMLMEKCAIFIIILGNDRLVWAIAFLGFPDYRIFMGWDCQPHA